MIQLPTIDGLDGVLKSGLLVDGLLHLLVRELFGEPHAHLFEAVEERLGLLEPQLHVPSYVERGVQLGLL